MEDGAVVEVAEVAHEAAPLVLLFIFISLALGIVIRFLVTHFAIPLPYTVCILVVSALLSLAESTSSNMFVGSLLSFELMKPDVIVFVFLPVLLFEGAFALDSQYLGRTWQAAVLLATFGVVIVTALMAVVGMYCLRYDWDWYTSFMFGALLAATDPVAVVAIMSELGGSKALATVIDGESLLNDGTAYILYLLFTQFATGTIHGVGDTVLQFIQISVGGPLFGLGCGVVIAFFLARVFNHPDVEITTTVVGAYLTFFLAQGPLGTSGVLAVVIFGMYLGKHRNTISPDVRHSLHATWSFLSYIANTLIFSLAGTIAGRTLFVTSLGTIDGHDVGNLILVYLMCNLQRACSVAILWPLIRRCVHSEVSLGRREFLQLSWSGLRGGMTLVLALLTYGNPLLNAAVRGKILFLSAGVVLLTLVINATTARPLLQGLGLHKGDKESQLVLSYAFLHMARRTENAVDTLKSQAHMQSVNWASLIGSIPNFREDRKPKASILASSPLSVVGGMKAEEKEVLQSDVKERETLIDLGTPNLRERSSRHLVMHRLLAFLRADFVAQYSAGLITGRSLNILSGAVRVAQDDDDLSQQWKHIRSHFVLSRLLLRLYSFDSVLRFSILSSYIARWLFSHLALSSELALALASSKQRLDERVEFFQSDLHIDAKLIEAVQTEFNDECSAAEEAANDVMTAFPQVREAVETRHAMQFILRLQRREIEDLLLSGLLEDAEAARLSAQVESQIYNLQLRPWKGQVELPDSVFLGLPFVKATSKENQQRGGIITQKSMALTPHHEDDRDQFMVKKNFALTFCEIYTLRLALLLELGSLNASFRYLLLQVVAGQLLRSRFQDCHKEQDLDAVLARAKVEWCALGAFEDGKEVSPTNKVYLLPGDRWLLIEGSGTAHYADSEDFEGRENTSLFSPRARNKFRPTLSTPNVLLHGPSSARSTSREVNSVDAENHSNNNSPQLNALCGSSSSCASSSPSLQGIATSEHISPLRAPVNALADISSSLLAVDHKSPEDTFISRESRRGSLGNIQLAHENKHNNIGNGSGIQLGMMPSSSSSVAASPMSASSRNKEGRESLVSSPQIKPVNSRAKSAKSNMRGHVGTTLPSFLPAPFFILFECRHSLQPKRDGRNCECHITIEVSRGAYLSWSVRNINSPSLEEVCVLTSARPEVTGEAPPDLMGVFQALRRQVSSPDFNKLDESARPDTD